MSILTPMKCSNKTEMPDEPPKLSPQVPLKSLNQFGDEDFNDSTDQRKDNTECEEFESSIAPNEVRSRLQLKPATSPKLTIEKYLTVSNSVNAKSVSTSLLDQSIKLKQNLVTESPLSDLVGERKSSFKNYPTSSESKESLIPTANT